MSQISLSINVLRREVLKNAMEFSIALKTATVSSIAEFLTCWLVGNVDINNSAS